MKWRERLQYAFAALSFLLLIAIGTYLSLFIPIER